MHADTHQAEIPEVIDVPISMATALIAANQQYWHAYHDFLRLPHDPEVCMAFTNAHAAMIRAAHDVANELKYRHDG